MPDHLHWQFQLLDKLTLSETVRRLKGRSSRAMKKNNLYTENVWQKGFFDHQIRNEKYVIRQARYIVANPLRAGIVSYIGDYSYWNCIYL